jgi:hypothetical protein
MMDEHAPDEARGWRRLLLPAEALALTAILVLVLADAILSATRAIPVDLASFAPRILFACALASVALVYRARRRSEDIPLALMACAILILFTNAGAILNYLVVPSGRATIDGLLARADEAIGFDWAAFTAGVGRWPSLNGLLGLVYPSSLGQITAMVLLLGLTGRQQQLHRFLACGILASLASIAIWTCMPSIGLAGWASLDPHASSRLNRALGPDNVVQLQALLLHGPQSVRADQMLGLIAFPSMHSVMMAMVVYYARGTRIFGPALLLNLPMIPAILLYGGHNLVDVFGGLVLFAATAALSARLIPNAPRAPASASAPVMLAGSRPQPA